MEKAILSCETEKSRWPESGKENQRYQGSSPKIVRATHGLTAQLQEHRARQRLKFYGSVDDAQEDLEIVFTRIEPVARSMNDEEFARRLATEEEDAAFAQALHLSEQANLDDEVLILDDFEPSSSNVPHSSASYDDNVSFAAEGIISTSSDESFASNPAMQSNLFHHKDADSGFTATLNVTERLRQAIQDDPSMRRFYLAADFFHVASIAEDLGNWSCGYRNAQLLISSFPAFPQLQGQLQKNLGEFYLPSILCLQNLIKKSWDAGWDIQGSREHRNAIISSKNWIGPVDLYSMFMNLGIECKIIAFVRRDKCAGPHPELFRWCAKYFTDGTTKPPLFLQHAGHSRSVVGWEEMKNGSENLLVSDPGVPKERVRWKGNSVKWVNHNFRKSLNAMRHESYELLYLTGRVLTPAERERARSYDATHGLRGENIVS